MNSVVLHDLIGSSISVYPALFTSEQNKMASRFVTVTEGTFLMNEANAENNSKKAVRTGNYLFKDMYFFYFSATYALKMSSKCFVYKWWVGDKQTFRKIVLKFKKIHLWKQLSEVYAKTIILLSVGE